MASFPGIKTTFEPAKSIQPIYTGGSVAADKSGRILVSCLGEHVLVTDLNNGEQLARIEGVCLAFIPLACLSALVVAFILTKLLSILLGWRDYHLDLL